MSYRNADIAFILKEIIVVKKKIGMVSLPLLKEGYWTCTGDVQCSGRIVAKSLLKIYLFTKYLLFLSSEVWCWKDSIKLEFKVYAVVVWKGCMELLVKTITKKKMC